METPAELTREGIEHVLALDPTLREDDRRVLGALLASGRWMKYGEIAASSGVSRTVVYEAVPRLEARNLVISEQGPDESKQARTSDPRLLVPELTAHATAARRQADELVKAFGELEPGLVRAYTLGGAGGPIGPADPVHYTRSVNHAINRLLNFVRGAQRDVWIVGTEAPWLGAGSLVTSELLGRASPPGPITVRLLVSPAGTDSSRNDTLNHFRNTSVEVRYTSVDLGSHVIVDGSILLTYQPHVGKPGSAYYVDVVAPDLCADLLKLATREWSTSAPPKKRRK